MNTTHMHFKTHPKPESVGQAGRWQSPYHDTMIDHDKIVGELLDQLDELGIAEDTIVIYSTDNGPHMNTWPDGGMTPFRSEKNTNWEGAFRIPEMIRWPGHIPAGVVSNEIVQHHDWLPTFLAAAGDTDTVEELKAGKAIGDTTYKVHIDGYNLLPYLTGEVDKSPRKGLVYFSDDGDVLALRFDNWKVVFMEQRVQGTLQVWAEPFVPLRVPKLFNLRTDPFERADVTSNTYWDWLFDNDYLILAAQAIIVQFLATFREFPPRQRAASFGIDQAVEKLQAFLSAEDERRPRRSRAGSDSCRSDRYRGQRGLDRGKHREGPSLAGPRVRGTAGPRPKQRDRGSAVGPGPDVHDGLGPALPRGEPGPSRGGRRVLAGGPPGHQRTVRRLRRRDRVRDRSRKTAGSGRLPRCPRREPAAGFDGLHQDSRSG